MEATNVMAGTKNWAPFKVIVGNKLRRAKAIPKMPSKMRSIKIALDGVETDAAVDNSKTHTYFMRDGQTYYVSVGFDDGAAVTTMIAEKTDLYVPGSEPAKKAEKAAEAKPVVEEAAPEAKPTKSRGKKVEKVAA